MSIPADLERDLPVHLFVPSVYVWQDATAPTAAQEQRPEVGCTSPRVQVSDGAATAPPLAAPRMTLAALDLVAEEACQRVTPRAAGRGPIAGASSQYSGGDRRGSTDESGQQCSSPRLPAQRVRPSSASSHVGRLRGLQAGTPSPWAVPVAALPPLHVEPLPSGRQYAHDKHAAMTIQAWVRRQLVTIRNVSTATPVVKCEPVGHEGQPGRKDKAATDIQAGWRGKLARCDVARRRAAQSAAVAAAADAAAALTR